MLNIGCNVAAAAAVAVASAQTASASAAPAEASLQALPLPSAGWVTHRQLHLSVHAYLFANFLAYTWNAHVHTSIYVYRYIRIRKCIHRLVSNQDTSCR